jgi:hypothetical protein
MALVDVCVTKKKKQIQYIRLLLPLQLLKMLKFLTNNKDVTLLAKTLFQGMTLIMHTE